MYKANATYFDGITSTPQHIELMLEERINELRFFLSDGNCTIWHLRDVQYEIYGNDLIEIRHASNPMALLKVNDKEFKENFVTHFKRKMQMSWYQRIIGWGFTAHLTIAISIFALIVWGYIFVVPYIAEKSAALIPDSFDDYLGKTFMFDYMTQHAVDSSKTVVLNDFAGQLELNNTKQLHFTVVNSDMVNAFALPDGNVVVFSGILEKMENYDELAGLIGHEVSHINGRHSVKMLCRNLAGYLFISAILTDVNGIMAIISENAHNLQNLSYSRQFESEADEQGTLLMMQNKINPLGMVQLFSRLQEEEKDETNGKYVTLPEFMSSHPATEERKDYIKQLIESKSHVETVNPELELLFRQLKP